MLWFPEDRKTRSGTTFASFFATTTLLKSPSFDVGPLLRDAILAECDEQEDREGASDDLDEPLRSHKRARLDSESLPDADSWLDELDEPQPLPPAPRHIPMAEVIAGGSKPIPHAHRKRAAKRVKKALETGQRPRPLTLREHVHAERAIPTGLNAAELPAAHGAYTAKAGDTYGGQQRRTLSDMEGMGFKVVQWNGIDARPIVDAHGRVIAVLAGQPRSPEYAAAATRAYDVLEEERIAANFKASMKHHRRGRFVALNAGISYGKGTQIPSRIDPVNYNALLTRLLGNTDIIRMATFASAAFALWAPGLYAYYQRYGNALHQRLPHLQRNFPKSIFSCATFNFGPSAWTFKHRDLMNLPFGMCAIQALGDFDPTAGGHLVLWELKLVVEFPPGALILLPSATLSHSNLPIGKNERRASFTQYTAGGIFRWVDNGFRTERELAREDPDEYTRILAAKDDRWAMGIGLLSTIDDLLPPITPE